jgi:hypothetical protein
MRALGHGRGIALALTGLGYIASVQGDPAASRACHEESLAIMQLFGDRRNAAMTLAHLGWVAIDQGEYDRARRLLAESLTTAHELGDARVVIDGLENFAYLAIVVGRADRAARLRGAAEALRERIGIPVTPGQRSIYDGDALAVRAGLGDATFAATWSEGKAMSVEQAVAYALHDDGVDEADQDDSAEPA